MRGLLMALVRLISSFHGPILAVKLSGQDTRWAGSKSTGGYNPAMRTPWLGVGLVILLVAPGCRTESQTPAAAAPRPSMPIVSWKEVSAIRDAYKLSGKLDDDQRQKLEDAALSPDIVASATGFLMMQIAFEDGGFDRDRIEELYHTKAAIVDPKGMHLVLQNYRSLLKVRSLEGQLPTDASTSGKWSALSVRDEKLARAALADPAVNVRAQAGAALAAYQWLEDKDRARVLSVAEQGLTKADSASERQYWKFIKAAVINRSP